MTSEVAKQVVTRRRSHLQLLRGSHVALVRLADEHRLRTALLIVGACVRARPHVGPACGMHASGRELGVVTDV
eukprot:2217939-Pleurochrysis_carterae.AAC.2